MIALGSLEDGAGELGVGGASKDALDCISAAIVPQLHSKGEFFLWRGSPITRQRFVLALPHFIEGRGATARRSMLRRIRTRYDIILVTQGHIAVRIFPGRGIISGVADAPVGGDRQHLLDT